jgi:hypothetical protein
MVHQDFLLEVELLAFLGDLLDLLELLVEDFLVFL